jgi:hypothetical protein
VVKNGKAFVLAMDRIPGIMCMLLMLLTHSSSSRRRRLSHMVVMLIGVRKDTSDPHYLYRPRPEVKACLNCGKPAA